MFSPKFDLDPKHLDDSSLNWWLAGLIDDDGEIRKYQIIVTLNSSEADLLYLLQSRFGGYVYKVKDKLAHRWTVGKFISNFSQEVYGLLQSFLLP